MTSPHRNFLLTTVSADALWLLLATDLAAGRGASVIRLGDGERALLALRRTGATASFLREASWLQEYGLYGADLHRIATDLHDATLRATWLAPSPSCAIDEHYDVLPYLQPRRAYAPCYYATEWSATGRHRELLRGQTIALCTRQAEAVAARVAVHLEAEVTPVTLSSWEDHDAVRRQCRDSGARVALVSAGPAGKALTVALGMEGMLALDIGTSLRLWHGGAEW